MKKIIFTLIFVLLAGTAVAGEYSGSATGTELDYMSGVTSAVQDQIDAITTILGTTGAADVAIIDGISDSGSLTAAELLYVDGVTSAIQTQLDARCLEADIDTLAELNAILTDAILLDDGAIADSTAIGLNAGDTYTNYGVVGDDTLNELLAAIDTALGEDIDPDRLSGDTTDDDKIDPGIINITSMDIAVDYDLLSSDETYSGMPLDGIAAGETVTKWQMVYYDTTATEWLLADADASGEAPAWGITLEAGNDGDEVMILQRGVVRYDTWAWTPGAALYLSDTAGGLTETAPSTATDIVQPVGIAITADIVLFDIDPVNGHYRVGS